MVMRRILMRQRMDRSAYLRKNAKGMLIAVFYNRNDALRRNWGVQVKEKVGGGGLRSGPSSIQREFKERR
jgi:hypothetical protein